jgi:hypothetical protein
MHRAIVVAALLVAATASVTPSIHAKDKPAYERGVLLQMDSTSCGYAEKDNKSVAGELLGTDDQHKKTQEVLCQEYVLKTDRLIYRIRPKDDKHPLLLPIGETAEFRIQKDKMLLHATEGDAKDREYIVVSITQRADAPDARASTKPASAKSPN